VTLKKRILFITHLYYPASGGAERVYQKIAEGLASRGHDVWVLTSDALSTEQYFHGVQGPPPQAEIVNRVRIIRQSLSTRIYRVLRYLHVLNRIRGFASMFGSLVFGPHFFKQFKTILKQNFDLVIAGPTPTTTIYYALLYRIAHRSSRLIFFPHMHTRDRMHTSPLNIWVLKRASGILATTDSEKNYLRNRGIKDSRLNRVANGVEDALLQIPPQKEEKYDDCVLFIGYEGEHKRIPLLIEAMQSVWKKGYINPLVIAGARTNFSVTIDEKISNVPLELQPRIFRINDFAEDAKVVLLDSCSVLVNPSSYESFGIVFLEAWARGKPVIGSRIPAVREIIKDGINGFLFDPQNSDDLEEKIIRLICDKSLANRMGRAGQAEVRDRYVWSKIVSQIEIAITQS
jgi:glycosyltransferase involved in cell wall biosynthesis